MKNIRYFFLSIFFVLNIVASESPYDSSEEFVLDQVSKKEDYQVKLAFFNELFPPQIRTEFEELVRAIEDPYHPLRRKNSMLPQGYVVFKYHIANRVTIKGIISSMRQFYEVLGLNYQYKLTQRPYVLFKHFKELQLADGEIVNIGALLLKTNDIRIMLDVIKEDIKRDHILMNRKL